MINGEKMTEAEKELFINDLKNLCAEYFENAGKFSVDVAGAERGLSICVVFDAARVKNFKKPL